jgi:hypothetical protein
MPRILAVADEPDRSLSIARIKAIAPDVVVSCGDLPFDYLEFVVTVANKPLLYVPGNHDPALVASGSAPGFLVGVAHGAPAVMARARWEDPPGPLGCTLLDGRVEVVAGLRFGGLGGSIRYRPEPPHMYTQRHMQRRVRRLLVRARVRHRGLDVFVAHSPPLDLGDMPDDAHRGFEAFRSLLQKLRPSLMLHGHVHPHGLVTADRMFGDTRIVNVIPSKVIEL